MLFKPVTVAALAASAATSHAFLLPPALSSSDVRIAQDIADQDVGITSQAAEGRMIYLDCPGCPVPEPNLRSKLELSFTIDHQTDTPSAGDRLLLNGFELYPNTDPFRSVLTASQMVEDEAPLNGQTGRRNWMLEPQRLGFGMHTGFVAEGANDGLELVAVDFQVIEIGNTFVAGVPELKVRLVKTPSGRLMIAKIDVAETTSPAPVRVVPQVPAGDAGKAQCKTKLCRVLKAVIESMKASGRKPCHSAAASAVSEGHHHGDIPPAMWAGRHGQGHGHGRHGAWRKMQPHKHSWGQLFKNIASHILLPVFIGIVAGVSVSLIGMVVGTVIVSLWRTFVRRPSHHHHHRRHHSSGHSRRKSVHKEVAVEDEKSGLMEHQDPPPSYEAEDAKKDADVAV